MAKSGRGQTRRDAKNRVLRPGESVRANGKYQYKYHIDGKPHFVYSWKLEPTDKLPKGKKSCLSLRELEKQINTELAVLSNIVDGQMTVCELVDRYLKTKTGVRESTKQGYVTVQRLLAKEKFGSQKIRNVKISDVKLFLIKLQQEDGKGFSTIHNIRGVLRPAFQMAVDDDILVKNPFGFQLQTVLVNDSVTREALSKDQMQKFLKFVHDDVVYCKYYEVVYILFHTGMRISEFAKNVGLSKDIIGKLERGNIDCNCYHLQAIAQYLQIPVLMLENADLSEVNLDMNPLSKGLWQEMQYATSPLIQSEEANKDPYFKRAYQLIKKYIDNQINGLPVFETMAQNALDSFIKSYEKNGTIESLANILCILMQIVAMTGNEHLFAMADETITKGILPSDRLKKYVFSTSTSSQIEVLSEQKRSTRKQMYDDFYDSIEEAIEQLKKSQNYSDLGDYYFALRYFFDMIDNEMDKYTNELFGVELLLSYQKYGNPYANNMLNAKLKQFKP